MTLLGSVAIVYIFSFVGHFGGKGLIIEHSGLIIK